MKRLSGWDSYMLYTETATAHQHTLKVVILGPTRSGEPLAFEIFRSTLKANLGVFEPLKYRLVDVPLGFHHPLWLENSHVDLDEHLRRAELPQPGSRRQLDDLIGLVASTPLERTRPLWEFTFVEGLGDGRVAVIGKVHHALADGIASANLLRRAVDFTPTPLAGETVQASPDPEPTRRSVLAAAAQEHPARLRDVPGLVARTLKGVRRLRADGPDDPPGSARMLHPPVTSWNRPLRPERLFGSASFSLADVKALSKSLGITLNDVVLGVVAGALRELMARHGESVNEALIAGVPTSLDPDPQRLWGNQLGALLISLPINVADPVERCQAASVAAKIAKRRQELLGPDLMQAWLEYLPPRPAARAFRRGSEKVGGRNRLQNVVVSNVPGPAFHGTVAGATMDELFSVGPLNDRCGLNLTIWSYVDQFNLSVLTDGQVLGGPHEILDGFAVELVKLKEGIAKSGTSGE